MWSAGRRIASHVAMHCPRRVQEVGEDWHLGAATVVAGGAGVAKRASLVRQRHIAQVVSSAVVPESSAEEANAVSPAHLKPSLRLDVVSFA